ncbi:MAG: precorrin-8X methylmutase, partial [Desulfatirhabdiaceae bacterium]
MKPEDIEAESFRIIDDEAGSHPFDPMTWSIVRRMIHTTADFEYIQSIRFHPEAVIRGISAIRSGKTIVTDTQMANAGIRQTLLDGFGGRKTCLI